MQIADLLILALATWYSAHTVSKTSGPFNVMGRFRSRVSFGMRDAQGYYCMVCAVPWIAGALYLLWQSPVQPVVVVLAVAGAALMLGSYSGANHT